VLLTRHIYPGDLHRVSRVVGSQRGDKSSGAVDCRAIQRHDDIPRRQPGLPGRRALREARNSGTGHGAAVMPVRLAAVPARPTGVGHQDAKHSGCSDMDS